MNKLLRSFISLFLILLLVLPATNIYASPTDQIYNILNRGSNESNITNPLLLKVLNKDTSKNVKIISEKDEFKEVQENQGKDNSKKSFNDKNYMITILTTNQ